MSRRINISMIRSGTNIPWGFTIRGGRDWNETVKITRITENTPASRAGLHSMDVIEVINGENTTEKTQKECTDLVKAAGLQLDLIIVTTQSSPNAFSPPQPPPPPPSAAVQHFHHEVKSSSSTLPPPPPPPPFLTQQFHHEVIPSSTLPLPPPPPPPTAQEIRHHEAITTLPPPPPPLQHDLHNVSNIFPPPPPPPPPPSQQQQPTTKATPIAAYQPPSHGLIPASHPTPTPPPPPPPSGSISIGGVSDSLSRIRINEPPKRPKPAVITDSSSPSTTKNQPLRDDPMAPYKVFPDQELYTEIPSRNTTFNKTEIPRCMICLELITTSGFHDVAGNAVCEKDYCCSICHLNLSGIGCCLEDKKIYCKQHFPSKSSLTCARCHEKIANTSVKAINKSWHPNCFACSICQKPIGKTSFIAPEDGTDNVICEPCYMEKLAPHCQGCQKPINVEALIVEVAGFKYHENCLLCSVCGQSLSGKRIARKPDGTFVCAEHANQK